MTRVLKRRHPVAQAVDAADDVVQFVLKRCSVTVTVNCHHLSVDTAITDPTPVLVQ